MHRVLVHSRAGLVKREEWGCNLLPLRAPHGLIKRGQQGLGEVAVSRETSFNTGTELPSRDFVQVAPRPTRGRCDWSHSEHLTE